MKFRKHKKNCEVENEGLDETTTKLILEYRELLCVHVKYTVYRNGLMRMWGTNRNENVPYLSVAIGGRISRHCLYTQQNRLLCLVVQTCCCVYDTCLGVD